jgi:hypothetical protein
MDQYDRMGYMEKRGATNTAWRDRWFVLQDQKLFYFKTHQHTKAITYIPLGITADEFCLSHPTHYYLSCIIFYHFYHLFF